MLKKLYLFGHPRGTYIRASIIKNLPENFRSNLTYNERENFCDSSLHHIFESENFKFSFFMKHSLTWAVKNGKLILHKIIENLLHEKPIKLYVSGMVI